MGEILHAGALIATALSTCCVAASRRPRVRDLALALLMLAAMVDLVAGAHLVAPIWWAAALLIVSLGVVVGPRVRAGDGALRSARAMDALGGVLMAALLVLMSPGGEAAASGAPSASAAVTAHAAHGGSGPVALLVVLGALAFGAAAIVMGAAMRMPAPGVWRHRVRRAAPISMGLSVALMAAVVVV
jgi:hypothetical protein